MYYQPKRQPYHASEFFEDGMSARPLVPGTVARDDKTLGAARYYKNAQPGHVELPPDPATAADAGFPADFPTAGADLQFKLARGQERYNIYCSVCHGLNGQGDGMIVQRGFTAPPSFLLLDRDRVDNPQRYEREQLLQTAPPRHFYNVMTNGFGAMYSYAERVNPDDRWAIAAYVKALQAAKPPPTTQGPAATGVPGGTRQTGNE
jgi:mono/diheme cytochrome c family protein